MYKTPFQQVIGSKNLKALFELPIGCSGRYRMVLCASPLASPIYTLMLILSNKNIIFCQIKMSAHVKNECRWKLNPRGYCLHSSKCIYFLHEPNVIFCQIKMFVQEPCQSPRFFKITLQNFPFSMACSLVTSRVSNPVLMLSISEGFQGVLVSEGSENI